MKRLTQRRIVHSCLVWLALLVALESVPVARAEFPHPEAPRLVNYYLRTDIEGKEEILAQWDILIFSYLLLDDAPASLEMIRALNPDQLLLAYIDPVQITQFPSEVPGHLSHDLVEGMHPFWLAYNEFGQIIQIWPNSLHVNYTDHCFVHNGLNYKQYFVQFVRERFFPLIEEGVIDGLFLDEMSDGGFQWWDLLFEGSFDYDMDEVVDDPDSVQVWLTAALTYFADSLALSAPAGGVILGNNCKPYYASLHGKFYESFPATWQGTLEGSLHDLDVWNSLETSPNVTSVNGIHIDDTPSEFRFRYTASLLSDNYFSYDHTTEDHYQLTWYELFDFELGLPLGRRYTIGESPLFTELFEGEIGEHVATAWMADLLLTDEPALVIEGQESLLMDVYYDGLWPSFCEILSPGGFQALGEYTVSFRYRVLESELDEARLFLKAKSEIGGAWVETDQARIVEGCQGLYRATFQLEDWDDYRLWLKGKGELTIVMDSLTVLAGPGGLWARDYEQGVVICNNSEVPQPLPYNDNWILVDADGQHEAYPGWLSGNSIALPDTVDGLVFRYGGTGVDQAPAAPAPAIALSAPWPNPGNPVFHLQISGETDWPATLTLHDVAGRRLATLWQGRLSQAGRTLSFRSGEAPLADLASGVYLIRAEGGGFTAMRKLILLR